MQIQLSPNLNPFMVKPSSIIGNPDQRIPNGKHKGAFKLSFTLVNLYKPF